MKEIWTDIKGYDGKYQVSTWGRVRGASGIIAPFITEKGYEKVKLWDHSVGKNFRVHRLVAEAFLMNFRGLPEVNHIDGNKRNNSVTNLEWTTGEDNRAHDARQEQKYTSDANIIKIIDFLLDPDCLMQGSVSGVVDCIIRKMH